VELLVAVGVGILLISLTAFVSDTFIKRARKVGCISNMRVLHSSLVAHATDKGHWPQMEEDRFDYTEEEFFKFWILSTEPYGMSQDSWICPSDRNVARIHGAMGSKYFGSYNVTRFDKGPATPFRWNQPWAMERGNLHGKGVHILMPDGSVDDSQNPFAGR